MTAFWRQKRAGDRSPRNARAKNGSARIVSTATSGISARSSKGALVRHARASPCSPPEGSLLPTGFGVSRSGLRARATETRSWTLALAQTGDARSGKREALAQHAARAVARGERLGQCTELRLVDALIYVDFAGAAVVERNPAAYGQHLTISGRVAGFVGVDEVFQRLLLARARTPAQGRCRHRATLPIRIGVGRQRKIIPRIYSGSRSNPIYRRTLISSVLN